MKNISFSTTVADRIDEAVHKAVQIYFTRLNTGFYEIGLEDTFKMHLGDILGKELELATLYPDERFIVMLEKNMPIHENKDYVDIVIRYQKQNTVEIYPMELKFRKITDYATDNGNIDSYIDICNLDAHKASTANIHGCYYIFMTDLETYTKQARMDCTRAELPMHDGYIIQKDKTYTVSGKSAKNRIAKKYPYGFTFHNDYSIEYEKVLIGEKPYWYYILKL